MSDVGLKNRRGAAAAASAEVEQWRAQFDAAAADAGTAELSKAAFLALAKKAMAAAWAPPAAEGGGSPQLSPPVERAGPSPQDLDAAFVVADADRNGRVDRQEFVAFVQLANAGQVAGLSSDAWYNPGAWGKKAEYKKQFSAATEAEGVAAAAEAARAAAPEPHIEVIRMWQLPDGFFELALEQQWAAVAAVTAKAEPIAGPRQPCAMALRDDALAVAFFLVTLGLPIALVVLSVALVAARAWASLASLGCVAAGLALHPMPRQTLAWRSSRLCLSLLRYFSFEFLIDRHDPLVKNFATPVVDSAAFQEEHLPAIYLACPHGVFNYGAVLWCCVSRWVCGWYQVTGAAAAVASVPGLRYMDQLIWVVEASRANLVQALRGHKSLESAGAVAYKSRRGGMVGMVPDGILGAFRSQPGVDELLIGDKRGLLRIATQEGATVYAAWFFGTTETLTVVQDPFGLLERLSRKLKAGVMGFYGRWGLPVPRRVPLSLCVGVTNIAQNVDPTQAEVEAMHVAVYGNLARAYEKQKAYAGYADRTLSVK